MTFQGHLFNTINIQSSPWGNPNSYNLDGTGVNMGIVEVGGVPDMTHNDFLGRLTLVNSTTTTTHATHCTSTMAGDGAMSVVNGGTTAFQWAGMAPAADIFAWELVYPTTDLMNGVTNQGIVTASNSWAVIGSSAYPNPCDLYGAYMSWCGEFDQLVRDFDLSIFFSAGNDQQNHIIQCGGIGYGSVRAPSTAKNVISVGAISKTLNMTNFSGWGPTQDGRLKPDVVSVGVSVRSAEPGNIYGNLSGTSMSCPAVAGTAGLLIAHFRNLNGSTTPEPALLKAIMLNTATDMGNTGPDYQFGYGRIDAVDAAQVIDQNRWLTSSVANSGVNNHSLNIAANYSYLKVMLSYSDKEVLANLYGTTPALINNLDLELVDPTSTIFLPLTLNPSNPANVAAPAVNNRDNVEQVIIQNPACGNWTIIVKGTNVSVSPQDYAITWEFGTIVNPLSINPPSATICNGNSITLTASGATSYSWIPSTGLSNPNISNPVANPNITTTYTVTGTLANSCTSIATATITVNPTPTVTISPSTTICNSQCTTLNATGGGTYSWSPSSGLSNPNISNPVANPNITTTYTVTGTLANGCTSIATATITVNPTPTVTISPSTTICNSQCTTLNATGGATYSWSPSSGLSSTNISNPVACPTVTTTYSVIITDANGCTNTATVTITINPPPTISISGNTTLCSGQSTTLTASGGVTYSWAPGGQTTTSIIVNPTVTSSYTVTGTNASGCTNTASVTVTITTPAITISGTNTICSGQSATLTASGGTTYSWAPGGMTTAGVIVNPTTGTTYTVTGTDANGCTNTASVTVNPAAVPFAGAGPDVVVTDFTCGTPQSPQIGTPQVSNYTYVWTASDPTVLSFLFPNSNYPDPTLKYPYPPYTIASAWVTFTVTVTDPSTNCTNRDDMLATIAECRIGHFDTAHAANPKVRNIEVYPNPANDFLNVKVELNENEKALFEIYDVLDRKIFAIELSSGAKAILIAELKRNVYFYKTSVDGVIIKTGKLLIIR